MKEVSKKNSKKFIKVYGSREHNLKDLSVNIPKEEITVITGSVSYTHLTLPTNREV